MATRRTSSRRKRSAIQHQRLAAKHAAKAEHHRKRAAHLGPEHGYDGTSMQAVAERAGVTKPVVYACFPGKDELFRALLAREEQRILAEIQGAFEAADLSDPETTLVEGYTGFLRGVAESPEV